VTFLCHGRPQRFRGLAPVVSSAVSVSAVWAELTTCAEALVQNGNTQNEEHGHYLGSDEVNMKRPLKLCLVGAFVGWP
jgi:hypothetical protein